MQIQIKLMGILREKTPPDGKLQIGAGGSIEDVLEALQISPGSVQVFTVNGNLIRDRRHVLSEGDELTVLPPVGGG